MAGDVNLDGRVDALDLQVSISQLGTDPQAVGVMPIADQNADGVVDMLDIQLVLEGYGEQTDIYTGLWDGSRLLAIVGGSAGFGSIGTGPVGGAWGEGPGITPVGNCWRSSPPPPPDDGPGMVPTLLRGDARANCATCPACDEPDPGDCYECDQAGKIIGGDITATPEQPLPGQTVCFTWEPFTVEGRKEKCKAACGDEGTECAVEMTLGASWVIEKKDPVTGQWDEANPVKSSAEGDQPNITGAVCEEYRFKLTSADVPAVNRCAALGAVTNIKEVQFAEFTLSSMCVADTPTNKSRTIVGIGEEVDFSVVEEGAGTPRWEVNGEDKGTYPSPYRVQAQESQGLLEVMAEINGCRRKTTLTVIEPSKKNYTVCAATVQHTFGNKNISVRFKLDLDPDTVSFYNLYAREGAVTATGLTGDYEANGAPAHPLGPWRDVRQDNTIRGSDVAIATFADDDFDQGSFAWNIPLEYVVAGGTIIHAPSDKYETQTFTMTTDCVKVSKGGFTTPFGCRAGATIVPNYDGCNINGE